MRVCPNAFCIAYGVQDRSSSSRTVRLRLSQQFTSIRRARVRIHGSFSFCQLAGYSSCLSLSSCKTHRNTSEPNAQDHLRTNPTGSHQSHLHRITSEPTPQDHLRTNRTGSPQNQPHRISSEPSAQDHLRANRTGSPQSHPHRITSEPTAQDLLRSNRTGSPQIQKHRITS